MKKLLPSTFYNPLSLLGSVVFLVNVVLIVFLALVQAFLKRPSPYADLVIFILLPFISVCGLALVIVGMARERSRLKAGSTPTSTRCAGAEAVEPHAAIPARQLDRVMTSVPG